jgi:hypothetical protein
MGSGNRTRQTRTTHTTHTRRGTCSWEENHQPRWTVIGPEGVWYLTACSSSRLYTHIFSLCGVGFGLSTGACDRSRTHTHTHSHSHTPGDAPLGGVVRHRVEVNEEGEQLALIGVIEIANLVHARV